MKNAEISIIQRGILYSVGLAFFVLVVVFTLWNWEIEGISLGMIWAKTNKPLFLLAIFLISLAVPCVSLRWRALFAPQDKKRLSPFFMTGVLCVAFVFNFVLPGPVGEGISAWILHKKDDVSFGDALAGLGLSRVIGLATACLIAGLVYILAPFAIPDKWVLALEVATGLLSMAAISLLAVVIFPQVPKKVLKIMQGWLIFQWEWQQRLFGLADTFLDALLNTASRGWKAYAESSFWAMFGHCMVALGIYCGVIAMGKDAEWSAVLFTYAGSIAGSIAMFLLPGSSIGWDILFAETLSITANLELPVAIAVTAIVRLQQVLVALFGVLMVLLVAKDLVLDALRVNMKGQESEKSHDF